MKNVHWMVTIVLVSVVVMPAVGQDVTFGGQVRPRFEYWDTAGTGNNAFTSMRTRAHLSASLERQVTLFIQVQDVRLWGEESNTLGDFRADNFDLHQGWVELRWADGRSFRGRIGRQVTSFGGERLIGAVEWTQQGRSFDGVRLSGRGGFGTVDVFGYKLAEDTDSDIVNNAELAGVYAVIDNLAGGSLDLFGIYDRVAGDVGPRRGTVGARLLASRQIVTFRAEASYQFGSMGDVDINAFMFGARIGASFAGGAGRAILWYDYLSGDSDQMDNTVQVFNTLFATNHKFYGFADIFLNIPVHTGGLGLQDVALKASYTVTPDIKLQADFHVFATGKRGNLDSRRFGEELDITTNYRYSRHVSFIGGVSHVFAGDALAAIGRFSEDLTFAYLMLDAKL